MTNITSLIFSLLENNSALQ